MRLYVNVKLCWPAASISLIFSTYIWGDLWINHHWFIESLHLILQEVKRQRWPRAQLEHVFLLVQLYSYVGEGLLLNADSFANPDGNLEIVTAGPSGSLVLTSALAELPSFQILLFMRITENNKGGLPSREARPLVHLPAIRDHKSLRWIGPLLSVLPGFGGVAEGGFDLGASLEQEKGLNGCKTAVDDCLNKCFSHRLFPLLCCEELPNEWRHLWWGALSWQ